MSNFQQYNTEKYYLGSICLHGHNWNNTGKSLRRLSHNDCVDCRHTWKAERKGRVKSGNIDNRISGGLIDARCKQFGNLCAYCGINRATTIDHFKPIANGGTHTIDNILPCCGWCNSSKQNNDAEHWYRLSPFYSKVRWKHILKVLSSEITPDKTYRHYSVDLKKIYQAEIFPVCEQLQNEGIEVTFVNVRDRMKGKTKAHEDTIRKHVKAYLAQSSSVVEKS